MDSLRGLGALVVLSVHATTPAQLDPTSTPMTFITSLDGVVPMFFVMSAFLLYRPFVDAHLGGRPMPWVGAYAWRRVLRIIPGYWVALTICALWLGLSGVFTLEGLFTYYGLAQVYRAETFDGGIGQAWTICIEAAFYLMLPLYAIAIRRLLRSRPAWRVRGELAGVAVLFGISLLYNAVVLSHVGEVTHDKAPLVSAYPAFLDHFAIGMGLAVLDVLVDQGKLRLGRLLDFIERHPGACWAVAGAAIAIQARGIGLYEGPITAREWFLRNLLHGVVAASLVLPTIFGDHRRGALRRFLGTPALLWLGMVSYGFYLYHLAVLSQLDRSGLTEALGGGYDAWVVWIALGAAGAAAFAAVSWYLLERRAMGLIRIVYRRRRAAQPAPAGAGR